jgi:prepilin-type N-terminal cleavage/methylation domain-containing protein
MLIRSLPGRRAFTLAEVIVSIAIIGVLAAAVVPTVRGRLREGYEDALVSEFQNVASAVHAYRQDVGKFPPRLSYLSALPASPVDKCNIALSNTAKNNWRGPYLSTYFPPAANGLDGLQLFQKDTLLDTLVTTANPTGFAIRISGLETQTAKNIDARIDGITGTSSGQIQYSNATWITINYIIPTKSGAC